MLGLARIAATLFIMMANGVSETDHSWNLSKAWWHELLPLPLSIPLPLTLPRRSALLHTDSCCSYSSSSSCRCFYSYFLCTSFVCNYPSCIHDGKFLCLPCHCYYDDDDDDNHGDACSDPDGSDMVIDEDAWCARSRNVFFERARGHLAPDAFLSLNPVVIRDL